MVWAMETHATKLLTLPRLARSLRLPVAWLRAEADAGRIPCLRIGRKRRFSLEAVERALLERAETEYRARA